MGVTVKAKVRMRMNIKSDSEDENDLQKFFAQLSKKNRMSLLKLMKRAEEQKEMLHKQEDILIEKIKGLEKLTKEHEKLKCSHDDLVQRYEKISIEQTSTSNVLSCVAQLEK
jgi:TRAP-type C4-dicarboxylate transport system substrate-binding protein